MEPVHAKHDVNQTDRTALCGENNVRKFIGPMYGKATCEKCLEINPNLPHYSNKPIQLDM